MRIEDNNGYEYRTNLLGTRYITNPPDGVGSLRTDNPVTFNFNNEGGVTLSDIIFISYSLQETEVEIFKYFR